MHIAGRIAWIFDEANFDADRIVGPEHLAEADIDRLAALAMRNFDPDFARHVRPGDVIVANHNFGYGHPHYPPMLALRRLGIAAIVAESFAPGYWREEMQEGFPQVTCPGILAAATRFAAIEIDLVAARVALPAQRLTLAAEPFTPGELAMLAAGGLDARLRTSLADQPPAAGSK